MSNSETEAEFHDCQQPSSSSDKEITDDDFVDAPEQTHNERVIEDMMKTHLVDGDDHSPNSSTRSPNSATAFSSLADEHLTLDKEDVACLEAEVEAKRRADEDALTDDEREIRRDRSLELKTTANECFARQEFTEAIGVYGEALDVCPLSYTKERCVLLSNRAAANMKLENYKLATGDCSLAIGLDSTFTKAFYRRALCGEQCDDTLNDSLADYTTVVELESTNQHAREAIVRVNAAIERRDALLKEKMMGQLKDLGNMFLRPFGMSTDNFKLEDNGQGGYSVNMKQ